MRVLMVAQSFLTEAVVRVLESTFEQELKSGLAHQRVSQPNGEPLVTVDPAHSAAAPLQVAVESGSLVNCLPGRSGMTYEIFSDDIVEIEDGVRGLARAVRLGCYRERVNDSGRRVKIVAQWQEGRRVVRPRYNVLRAPKRDVGGWRTVRYEPYRPVV